MKKRTKPKNEEERLKKKKDTTQPQGAEHHHLLRLIHELHVHQLELEMQNEQLIQSRAEAEEAYRQYTDLYDFAPVGYFTLARDGTVRRVNLPGADLLGVEHVNLINQQLGRFVSNASLSAFNVFFAKLLFVTGSEICELEFLKGDHSPLWVRIDATCFEGGEECRAVMMDISERKRMEHALQESEHRFRTTIQEVETIAVQGYGMDGTTQYWNTASERLYGYSAHEAIGRNVLDLIIPPEIKSDVWEDFQKMAKSGTPTPAVELSLMRKDGSRVTVYSSHAVISIPGFPPELFCLDVDLTERKQIASLLQARVQISEFADTHPLDEFLQRTLDEAETLTDSSIGFIHFLHADQETLILQTWSSKTLEENKYAVEGKGQHYAVKQAGVWADCIAARVPVIHNDYSGLVNRKGLPQGHALIGRELVIPVLRNDLIVMIMGVGNKSNNYIDSDVETLNQLANSAWDIVQRKQAEQALEAANIELQTALLREQQLSRVDGLTGVNNRRHLYEIAEHEFRVALRYERPLSVIMFDIDHFKNVNDTFGHEAGDQILKIVTDVTCAELRSADVIGRYGGEEFIILLPMTSGSQAFQLAERIRMNVAALRVPTPKGNASVTLSIGVVELMHSSETTSVEDIFRHVDEALYAAKQAGRNRTEIEQ